MSASSNLTRSTESSDNTENYKKRICKSLADPKVFADCSYSILKQLEDAKDLNQAVFIDVIYSAISNELILPIARFQALFYLKLATERQNTDTSLLKVISTKKPLIDSIQQQCLFDKELPVSCRGRNFFTDRSNIALSTLGANYIRLLLEMVHFWNSSYGNLTELVDETAKTNSFRQLLYTLTLVHNVEFPKEYFFYKVIDWNRVKHVNCKTIMGQLDLSNSKLKQIREKMEELLKYITILKEGYLSFKKKPSSIQVVSLKGIYSKIQSLYKELQNLANEARFIPEKDASVLLEELNFLLQEVKYMHSDFQLFFAQKITAQEHTSKMVALFSNKEIGSPLDIVNEQDAHESAMMNVREKVSQMRTISDLCGVQKQSNLKTLTLIPTKSGEENFLTLENLESRGSKTMRFSKFSRANLWLQEKYMSTQLVPIQVTTTRNSEKQNTPVSRLYSAREKGTGESLAIKFICFRTTELYDRACSSIMSMMKIQNHRNAMKIKDVFFDSDKLEIGYATSLGRNMEAVLDGDENLHIINPERALDILQELVSSLIYAQELEVSHRNIKPSNIIEVNGVYKLCDWGMLWHASEALRDRVYCAPELVARDKVEATTAKGDIYSLGMILLRFLWADLLKIEDIDRTEEAAYKEGIFEIIYELDVKSSVKELLMKMLEWNPQDRIGLEDLQNQLQKLTKSL